MPKKGGKGKKGGKKGKKSKVVVEVPQTGPLRGEGTIDPVKGGTVRATRMGRTYELVVPPRAVDRTIVASILVTEYEGGAPSEFRLEGRIVSNNVEISPADLMFDKPARLTMPHFCADADGGKLMYFAQLCTTNNTRNEGDESPRRDEEDEQVDGYREIEYPGRFNTGTGFASTQVRALGSFLVCSKNSTGLDYAVTKYSVDTVKPGGTMNAVAYDVVQGKIFLWTRTSLDRPIGMDGPVIIKRRERLIVDFEARKLAAGESVGPKTYEQTFQIPGMSTSLWDGKLIPHKDGGELDDDVYELLHFEVSMVDLASAGFLTAAEANLERAQQDLKAAEENAAANGRPLGDEARKPLLLDIEAAQNALKATQDQCLPWNVKEPEPEPQKEDSQGKVGVAEEGSKEEGEAADAEGGGGDADDKENVESASENVTTTDDEAVKPSMATLSQTGSFMRRNAPVPVEETVDQDALERFKSLPQWQGRNMVARFGVQMVPSPGFLQEHLSVHVLLLRAHKSMKVRRLLEIPAMPGPGGKVTKVWVGPERQILFPFSPMLCRASYAELTVSVMLGAWTQKSVLSLSTGGQTLTDVRRLMESYCYGRNLSDCRFSRQNGALVPIDEEGQILAESLRPCVSLVGTARRALNNHGCNALLSYSSDVRELVAQVFDSLRTKGFPVWMDKTQEGAGGIDGLEEAGLIVPFITKGYNDSAHAHKEYDLSVKRGVKALLVWPRGVFEPTGWLKKSLKEKERRDMLTSDAAHSHDYHVDVPEGMLLTSEQLEALANQIKTVLPTPPAPVIFHKRMPAPLSTLPPVSIHERIKNAPKIVFGEDALQKAIEAKKAKEATKDAAKDAKGGKGADKKGAVKKKK